MRTSSSPSPSSSLALPVPTDAPLTITNRLGKIAPHHALIEVGGEYDASPKALESDFETSPHTSAGEVIYITARLAHYFVVLLAVFALAKSVGLFNNSDPFDDASRIRAASASAFARLVPKESGDEDRISSTWFKGASKRQTLSSYYEAHRGEKVILGKEDYFDDGAKQQGGGDSLAAGEKARNSLANLDGSADGPDEGVCLIHKPCDGGDDDENEASRRSAEKEKGKGRDADGFASALHSISINRFRDAVFAARAAMDLNTHAVQKVMEWRNFLLGAGGAGNPIASVYDDLLDDDNRAAPHSSKEDGTNSRVNNSEIQRPIVGALLKKVLTLQRARLGVLTNTLDARPPASSSSSRDSMALSSDDLFHLAPFSNTTAIQSNATALADFILTVERSDGAASGEHAHDPSQWQQQFDPAKLGVFTRLFLKSRIILDASIRVLEELISVVPTPPPPSESSPLAASSLAINHKAAALISRLETEQNVMVPSLTGTFVPSSATSRPGGDAKAFGQLDAENHHNTNRRINYGTAPVQALDLNPVSDGRFHHGPFRSAHSAGGASPLANPQSIAHTSSIISKTTMRAEAMFDASTHRFGDLLEKKSLPLGNTNDAKYATIDEMATFMKNAADKIVYQLDNWEPQAGVRASSPTQPSVSSQDGKGDDTFWSPLPYVEEGEESGGQQEEPLIIIGMCTVGRARAKYLGNTLRSLISGEGRLSASERGRGSGGGSSTYIGGNIRVVVYNANTPPEGHAELAELARVSGEFKDDIESGLLRFIDRNSQRVGPVSGALLKDIAADESGKEHRLDMLREVFNPISTKYYAPNVPRTIPRKVEIKNKHFDQSHRSPSLQWRTIDDEYNAKYNWIARSMAHPMVPSAADETFGLYDASAAVNNNEYSNGDGHGNDAYSIISGAPERYRKRLYSQSDHGLIPLARRWNDDHKRLHWRAKQSLDAAFLMDYVAAARRHVQPISEDASRARGSVYGKESFFETFSQASAGAYFLMLEDDIDTTKHFISKIRHWLRENREHSKKRGNGGGGAATSRWSVASFYNPWTDVSDGQMLPPNKFFGMIGQLFRVSDLAPIAAFIRKNYDQSPLDWLMVDYLKKIGGSMIVHTPSLFEHLGTQSSLDGKEQPAHAADFVRD